MKDAVDRKVLVTGANGFLARAVVALAPPAWTLIALTRQPGSGAPPGYASVFHSIDEVKKHHPDLNDVLHLAAHIPTRADAPDPRLIDSNIELVSRLVRTYPAARHVHASSVSVYGTPQTLPITVSAAFRYVNRYGLSKLAGECAVRQSESHAVIRFSSIIGEGMRAGTFIPHSVAGARRGSITIHGTGQRLQNYIDVRDAAAMCLRAVERTDSFVTLGIGSRSHSNLEVAELLSSITGAVITHIDEDPSPSYAYSIENAVDLGPNRYTLLDTLLGMTGL